MKWVEMDDKAKERFAKMYQSKEYSVADIARRYGINSSQVAVWARLLQLPTRIDGIKAGTRRYADRT